MLIGIDASRANRSHKTGTEWYSYHLIRWLAKLDKKNEYILYSDAPLRGGLLDLTTEQHFRTRQRDEIKIDRRGYQKIKSPFDNFRGKILRWPFLFFWTQGRLSLEMLYNAPDVLFVPAHTIPFIHRKNTIMTIHDIGFERDRMLYRSDSMGPANLPGRRLINALVRLFTLNKFGANSMDYLSWSTRHALKHASKIITVSDFTKKELSDVYGTDKDRINVIYNGYNTFQYKPVVDKTKITEVLDKYGVEMPYFLYVGRLEKKKNTPALIEAYARFREKNGDLKHKLVLVGDAGFGYDEVKYMIREFGLDNDVIMPGWVAELDMPCIFCGADAFIFPSRYEGFGIPLLEAMACGIPVAASWASSIPEVVGNAALLFNPHEAEAIACAMSRIVTEPELRADLIVKGHERVKKFSWKKCAEETLGVITG